MPARSALKLFTLSFSLVSLLILAPARPASAAIMPCTVTWGTYVSSVPVSMANVQHLDSELNRHSQIIHMYTQWGASWGTFAFNAPLFANVHNYSSAGSSGSIPLLTWEAWGPNFSVTPAEFPLTSIANGNYDGYIDSWATGLKSLGYQVYLDFGHEMNGNWYPWDYGVNGNTPAQYIAAFRHVHDRFARVGASNVLFVWNPDHWSPSGIAISAFWPGDAYVDELAIDVYNWNSSWNTPYNNLQASYAVVTGLSAKPLMLAEIGSENSPPAGANPPDKAAWIRLLAQTLPSSFPRVKAVVWFNELNTAFVLDSPASVLSASQAAFGSCGSPPPPPTPTPTPRPTPTPTPLPTATPTPAPTATTYPTATPTPTHPTPAPGSPRPGSPSAPAGQPSASRGAPPTASPAAKASPGLFQQLSHGLPLSEDMITFLKVMGWGLGIVMGLRLFSRIVLGR